MKKIQKVRKNGDGVIEAVKFKGNTTFTSIETAVKIAEREGIDGAHVVQGKHNKFLRSNPDGGKRNNLDELE